MLFLEIDSGTKSTKALVLDIGSGEVIALAQRNYGAIAVLPPKHVEQEPKACTGAAGETVAQCLNQIGKRRSAIKAIEISG